MRRRTWLLAAASLAACRRRPPSADALLPAVLAGKWRRRDLRDLPAESAPAEAARGTVRRIYEAFYEGPTSVQVDLFELVSATAGLDLAQRWRPAAAAVFFYKDNYFAVVKWQSFDRGNLTAFVRALEQHLGSFGAGRAAQ
ncbi:MAG TPA: hypothetical protein VFA33_29255 [Bryobacteraceae bacterium]|nr:hypothetical protein [Bryobacteraceae bacterium]